MRQCDAWIDLTSSMVGSSLIIDVDVTKEFMYTYFKNSFKTSERL